MIQKESQQSQRIRPTQLVASFLLKTYEILERTEFEHIICWDTDNIGFVIKNVLEFSREVLPKYFRHNNFSSFVRQLNMYDFHKIKQINDSMVFKNHYFRRDSQHLLKQIKRKAPKRNELDRKGSQEESNKQYRQKKHKNKKEIKNALENEISNSANLFQKSIKLLETQFQENQKFLVHISNLTLNKESMLQSSDVSVYKKLEQIYRLKKLCFRNLEKYQRFHCQVDDSFRGKQEDFQRLYNMFEGDIPNKKNGIHEKIQKHQYRYEETKIASLYDNTS